MQPEAGQPSPGENDSSGSAAERLPRRARVAVLAIAGLLASVCAATVGGAAWTVVRASADEAPASVDAVVVFAGDSGREPLALEIVDRGGVPVVVFSHGGESELVGERCGETEPVEVLCPLPDPSSTLGEARMFAALANERGWRSVLAVTSDYHLARVRLLMTRCFNGDVAVADAESGDVPWGDYQSETAKYWVTRYIRRSC